MSKDADTTAINTSCYVQVLGVGSDTGCTVPSALLFFDRQRYLFNVGEGFQRFCVEHKIKLTKITSVLTTRVTTEATGGLPGMLLTMADTTAGGLLSGYVGMTVHGPPGLHTLVNAFRTFVNVRDMGLKVMEFGSAKNRQEGVVGIFPRPVIKNDTVTITPVIIRSEAAVAAAAASHADAPLAKRQKTNETGHIADGAAAASPTNPQTNNNSGGNGGGVMDVPSTAVESSAACYVCELPDIPGKFLPKKAASLGVPRGPMYGQLVKGQEVTAVNGRVVRPEDVMEASTPGPVVIVVDCPSEGFISALADSANGVGKWAADAEARGKVACIVHLTPRNVLATPAYRLFIESFGIGDTRPQHILVAESEGSKIPIMKKSAVLQVKLNMLDDEMFTLPPEADQQPPTDADAAAAVTTTSPLPANCIAGKNMVRFNLRPVAKRGLNYDECGEDLDAEAVREELKKERPQALEEIEKARALQSSSVAADLPPAVAHASPDDLAITFLGTGAAIPSKYRNVTGIFIDMPSKNAAMLADCGEGSLGQLHRRHGAQGAIDAIKRLKLVWISHIHADHHVGLPAVLALRTKLLGPECEPLLVVGPRPLRRALVSYASLEPMRFRFVEAAHTTAEATAAAAAAAADGGGLVIENEPAAVPAEVQSALDAAKQALGISRVESVRVVHCAHSYGLLLESSGEHPWKLVFSGDTRPCEAIVDAAMGATLLIHEATFDDSMLEEAIGKKHCTTKEAVETGVAAGVYRTLLTHFSQRYPKVPVIDENFEGHVGIAFDLMTVRLTDLPRLPVLVPAVKVLFEEEEEEESPEDAEPEPQMFS